MIVYSTWKFWLNIKKNVKQNGKCVFSHVNNVCIPWIPYMHDFSTVMITVTTGTICGMRTHRMKRAKLKCSTLSNSNQTRWHFIFLTQLNISNHFIFMLFVNLSCHITPIYTCRHVMHVREISIYFPHLFAPNHCISSEMIALKCRFEQINISNE